MLALGVSHTFDFVALVAAMVVLLYGPKFLALALVLRDPGARAAHGGGWNATFSVLIEAAFSTLLAPISILSQSAFVVRIMLGETQGWGGQFRGDRTVETLVIARAFAVHTAVGVAAAVAIYEWFPASLWLFVPLLAGPILSIPLVRLTSSIAMGLAARRIGLFVTPAETGRVAVADRVRALMAA
jgi:membrane glycosyltransferase